MKIENTEVFGFKAAIHGMRNPMNSWDKSDYDEFIINGGPLTIYPDIISLKQINDFTICFRLGKNDNELAKKLIKAGSEHRKFLRLIHVSCFITLPRYIWQELDTYKVSTVRMSCSTMHKLGMTNLTKEDFQDNTVLPETLRFLNELGSAYRTTKNVELLRQMKQILPEGFLQGADYDMNYETAMSMYHQRKHHRMTEWSGKGGICEWIESLPMMNEWLNL
jgi:hypothetical protein